MDLLLEFGSCFQVFSYISWVFWILLRTSFCGFKSFLKRSFSELSVCTFAHGFKSLTRFCQFFGPVTSSCLDLFLSCPWFQIILQFSYWFGPLSCFISVDLSLLLCFFSSFRTSVGPFFFISVRGFKSFSRFPQYFVLSPWIMSVISLLSSFDLYITFGPWFLKSIFQVFCV